MKVKDLSLEHLREHPVWTWDDSRDYYVPVATQELLPTDTDVLFVRARLIAVSGRRLEGMIVNPPVPYAIEVFVGTESVGFNRNVPQFARKELSRLYALLKTEPFALFPVRYETDHHFLGQPNVEGIFEMEVRDST